MMTCKVFNQLQQSPHWLSRDTWWSPRTRSSPCPPTSPSSSPWCASGPTPSLLVFHQLLGGELLTTAWYMQGTCFKYFVYQSVNFNFKIKFYYSWILHKLLKKVQIVKSPFLKHHLHKVPKWANILWKNWVLHESTNLAMTKSLTVDHVYFIRFNFFSGIQVILRAI